MPAKRGIFITFEGIEGSGKTTQIALLEEYLYRKGEPVLRTREPGGTKIGDAIRHLLLDLSNSKMDPKAELFLYLASRAQHIAEVIRPALESGKTVLCDRFTDATIAYQRYGREIAAVEVEQAAAVAAKGVSPVLTFLLDIEPKKAVARLTGRREINHLDRESLAFYKRVRDGYLAIARANRKRVMIIPTDRDISNVASEIRDIIDDLLRHRRP